MLKVEDVITAVEFLKKIRELSAEKYGKLTRKIQTLPKKDVFDALDRKTIKYFIRILRVDNTLPFLVYRPCEYASDAVSIWMAETFSGRQDVVQALSLLFPGIDKQAMREEVASVRGSIRKEHYIAFDGSLIAIYDLFEPYLVSIQYTAPVLRLPSSGVEIDAKVARSLSTVFPEVRQLLGVDAKYREELKHPREKSLHSIIMALIEAIKYSGRTGWAKKPTLPVSDEYGSAQLFLPVLDEFNTFMDNLRQYSWETHEDIFKRLGLDPSFFRDVIDRINGREKMREFAMQSETARWRLVQNLSDLKRRGTFSDMPECYEIHRLGPALDWLHKQNHRQATEILSTYRAELPKVGSIFCLNTISQAAEAWRQANEKVLLNKVTNLNVHLFSIPVNADRNDGIAFPGIDARGEPFNYADLPREWRCGDGAELMDVRAKFRARFSQEHAPSSKTDPLSVISAHAGDVRRLLIGLMGCQYFPDDYLPVLWRFYMQDMTKNRTQVVMLTLVIMYTEQDCGVSNLEREIVAFLDAHETVLLKHSSELTSLMLLGLKHWRSLLYFSLMLIALLVEKSPEQMKVLSKPLVTDWLKVIATADLVGSFQYSLPGQGQEGQAGMMDFRENDDFKQLMEGARLDAHYASSDAFSDLIRWLDLPKTLTYKVIGCITEGICDAPMSPVMIAIMPKNGHYKHAQQQCVDWLRGRRQVLPLFDGGHSFGAKHFRLLGDRLHAAWPIDHSGVAPGSFVVCCLNEGVESDLMRLYPADIPTYWSEGFFLNKPLEPLPQKLEGLLSPSAKLEYFTAVLLLKAWLCVALWYEASGSVSFEVVRARVGMLTLQDLSVQKYFVVSCMAHLYLIGTGERDYSSCEDCLPLFKALFLEYACIVDEVLLGRVPYYRAFDQLCDPVGVTDRVSNPKFLAVFLMQLSMHSHALLDPKHLIQQLYHDLLKIAPEAAGLCEKASPKKPDVKRLSLVANIATVFLKSDDPAAATVAEAAELNEASKSQFY